MSALPNSHEALLRNRQLLTGRVALLGVNAAGLLPALPMGGIAMSEHAGYCQALAQDDRWQVRFGYDDPAFEQGAFDSLVVFLPKARAELDFRLALARWLAAEGAKIILVGEKKEGIAGGVKQFKTVAPEAAKVDSARHCQVWCAEGITPLDRFDLGDWTAWHSIACAGSRVEVAGLPGIFSQGALDAGTEVLLQSLADAPLKARVERVLDFACGAGVVGSWLQSWQRAQGVPVSSVDGVDVQSQAVICARETYARAGAAGVITASDGLAGIEGRWQAIVSNPPFHAGVKTDTSMTETFLREAAKHLVSGGELRLVANTFLPYESSVKRFVGPVERLYEDRRFTIYRAFRR